MMSLKTEGFFDAFKDFIEQPQVPPSSEDKKLQYSSDDSGDMETVVYSDMNTGLNKKDVAKLEDFDSDYNDHSSENGWSSDSDFSDARTLSSPNHDKNLSVSSEMAEEASRDNSNSWASFISEHCDEKDMESAIYIDDNGEVPSSLGDAVTSVLKEFQEISSDDNTHESDAYEAIFVPLETINCNSKVHCDIKEKTINKEHFNPDSVPNENVADTSNYSLKSNFPNINEYRAENKTCFAVKRKFYIVPSPDKENHDCNMPSISSSKQLENEPKVVVEMAPALDICLTDISALKDSDGDSEKEFVIREDTPMTDYSVNPPSNDPAEYEMDLEVNKTFQHVTVPENVEEEFQSENDKTIKQVNHKSPESVKISRKKLYGLVFDIIPGEGVKLKDIEHIAAEVEDAPPEILPVFHSILFDISGSCKNKQATIQTKKNILEFSGFTFEDGSRDCGFKKLRLLRIPFQILSDIAHILLRTIFLKRVEMVQKILQFLLKPTGSLVGELKIKKKYRRKHCGSPEYSSLKEKLLQGKGPVPRVVLERVEVNDTRRLIHLTQEKNNKSMLLNKDSTKKVGPLSYHLKNGLKSVFNKHTTSQKSENKSDSATSSLQQNQNYLACLSDVTKTILIAPNQTCNTIEIMKSGSNFSSPTSNARQTDNIIIPYSKQSNSMSASGKTLKSFQEVVSNIISAEEKTIHYIHLLLFGTTEEDAKSRNNILEFCGFPPSQSVLTSKRQKYLDMMPLCDLRKISKLFTLPVEFRSKNEIINTLLEYLEAPSDRLMKNTVSSKPVTEQLLQSKAVGTKLKMFDKVRSNVECATPEDLVELHDVLYVKACDSFEIHQRILDFEGFPFQQDSMEFHYRKTLMTYMSFSSVQKIATLLDIPNHFTQHYQDELITCVLKFLMGPKLLQKVPVSGSCKISSNKAHIVMLREKPKPNPCILTPPSESSSCNSGISQICDEEINSCHSVEVRPCNKIVESYSRESSYRSFAVERKRSPSPQGYSFNSFKSQKVVIREDISSSSEDESESMPLTSFVSHPSDRQLRCAIQEIIQRDIQSLTMKGLVNAIYAQYPQYDLKYRANFIKSKARKVLSSMQRQPPVDGFNCARPCITNGHQSITSYCDIRSKPLTSSTCTSISKQSEYVHSALIRKQRTIPVPDLSDSNEERELNPHSRNYLLESGIV